MLRYHVIELDAKDNKNYKLVKIYDDVLQAEKKVSKLNKLGGKNINKVIKVPDVRAGLKIYKSGMHYMTIVKETSCCWFLNNTSNPMYYDDCMLKDHIYKYFYLGIYDDNIEQYDSYYEHCVVEPEEEIEFEEELEYEVTREVSAEED